MVVSGASVSMTQVYVSGVASTLPTVSFARTANVCEPSRSAVVANGVVQTANVPPSTAPQLR